MTHVFNLIESDVGRPISHISHKLGKIDLEQMIEQVMASRQRREFEFQIDEEYFQMRILPYRIASEVYAGVVLVMVDITQLRESIYALSNEV